MVGRVVSFVWNRQGMGHASRLSAVHTALRDSGWSTKFIVEHEQSLLTDYGFDQTVIPTYPANLVGDDWWGSGNDTGREIAHGVVAQILNRTDVVLHDVVIHDAVYTVARDLGCRQFLVHRARKDRLDPGPWVAAVVPEIDTVYLIGRPEYADETGGVRVLGVADVCRRVLGEDPAWEPDDGGTRIAISAAGGGHPDAAGFLNAALEAVNRLATATGAKLSVLVSTGPYFRGELVVPTGLPARLRIVSYMDAKHSLYTGTDILITLGGYNTVQELRCTTVPAVTVPGRRQLDDQRLRLESLAADTGALIAEANPDDLTTALNTVFRTRTPRRAAPPPRGAHEIARDISRRVAPITSAPVMDANTKT